MTGDASTGPLPPFRPADQVTNPRLFDIARRRWPGVPITSAMLTDAATLSGNPLYVAATDEAIRAGLAAIESDRRRHATQTGIAADYRRLGFNPGTDYHQPKEN